MPQTPLLMQVTYTPGMELSRATSTHGGAGCHPWGHRVDKKTEVGKTTEPGTRARSSFPG